MFSGTGMITDGNLEPGARRLIDRSFTLEQRTCFLSFTLEKVGQQRKDIFHYLTMYSRGCNSHRTPVLRTDSGDWILWLDSRRRFRWHGWNARTRRMAMALHSVRDSPR